jgi:hypothetical protein
MVIPISKPSAGFDFDWEATTAACNEACAGEAVVCTWDELCPECQALKNAIKKRLIRAYAAGEASMRTRLTKEEDGNE